MKQNQSFQHIFLKDYIIVKSKWRYVIMIKKKHKKEYDLIRIDFHDIKYKSVMMIPTALI